jgi:hypothetical protein
LITSGLKLKISFPYGLQKTIPKGAKTLQIKSLQGFLLASKTPYYAPKRNKNERNSVRIKWKNTTHRIAFN